MTSEPGRSAKQLFPYVENPTRMQRFCKHYFKFAVGFGLLLGMGAVLSGGVVQAVVGGAFLATGAAAGYHTTY